MFTACEEEFYLTNNSHSQSNLVVNSVFHSDSLWQVKISTSRDIFVESSSIRNITDAYVWISDKTGQTVTLLDHVGNGIYQSKNSKPVPGEYYRLMVHAPGFEMVSATSYLPHNPEITNIEILDGSDEDLFELSFDLVPKSGELSYSTWDLVNMKAEDFENLGNGKGGGFYFDLQLWLHSLDDQIRSIKNTPVNNPFFVSNLNFTRNSVTASGFSVDENTFNVDLDIELVDNNGNGGGNDNGEDIDENQNDEIITLLRVMTVSEDLYKFFKSLESHLLFENHNNSLAEPTDLYHNVQNGIGIFAGYSVKYVKIEK
jgi:hypothetical protein